MSQINKYYVDLHVHIGRSSEGHEVKKATANNLTFENIAHEAYYRKGIHVIGVVDCLSPFVQEDIEALLEKGMLAELPEGGMTYMKNQVILLGAEIETHEYQGCSAHSLSFFPTLRQLKAFSVEMSKHIKNMRYFSSMSRLNGQGLFDIVDAYGGIFIPAHVFSPHKSFYGNCCDSLLEIFSEAAFSKIPAIELGLSADAELASQLSELDKKTFISNSDAHSLGKMGREYNILEMEKADFSEVLLALRGQAGRRVAANYGLDPRLGKYHRTFCLTCDRIMEGEPPILQCDVSVNHPVVVGVLDRIERIKDKMSPDISGRAPYYNQIPLAFLPKVGPKTIDKLIAHFGNEMKILHDATSEELAQVVKPEIADRIILAREGRLGIEAGGGGIYGKIGMD